MQTDGSSDIYRHGSNLIPAYSFPISLGLDFTLSFLLTECSFLWTDVELYLFLSCFESFFADLSCLFIEVELISFDEFYTIDSLYLLEGVGICLVILVIYF
jgi:hypothetical protein